MSAGKILATLLQNIDLRPRPFFWTWAVVDSRLTAVSLDESTTGTDANTKFGKLQRPQSN